jgi:hypothetical protein
MSDLVARLSVGDHPVVVGGFRPSVEDFKNRVTDMGYAFVKFTDTVGGTDLGFAVDHAATRLEGADFDEASGMAHVEGVLTLDGTAVTVVADIELSTMAGTGHLVPAVDAFPPAEASEKGKKSEVRLAKQSAS